MRQLLVSAVAVVALPLVMVAWIAARLFTASRGRR